MHRLVQLTHPRQGRRAAIVDNETLLLIEGFHSIYDLAMAAIHAGQSLAATAQANISESKIDYTPVYLGESDWRLLPAFDHPEEPARCLVTGTGLTHKASAENRQAMHAGEKQTTGPITDSMRMYQWGLEGGRPPTGQIGAAPEWFYKGCGTILRAHGDYLDVPAFAEDGGEEGEVAGIYIVDSLGAPRRVGFAIANEFSDHQLERRNYLYLAPSKLRACSIGPELVLDHSFDDVPGEARIERNGQIVWTKPIFTGQKNMSHTLANLEHHHFKYPAHRRPGDAHVHFFGADAFSFGDGVSLQNGDWMEIRLAGFGRPLRNPIRIDRQKPALVTVPPL